MDEESQENATAAVAGSENETLSANELTGTRPTMKFSGTGGIVVSVWKSKSEAGYDSYNARLERNFRKEDGTFAGAKSLRDSDLLRAQQLLGQADAWIEQDKAKGRGATSATTVSPTR